MTLDPAVAATRLAVRRVVHAGSGPVLVACSGGADSLALLVATVFELRRSDRRVLGVTVDHGLQEGSADHAADVVRQMAGLGADETMSVRVTVDAPGLGVEAAARQARYAALGQAAASSGATLVLLGHTLDDQAETVLMGLTRGSGGRSLAGMRRGFREGEVAFARPLLDLTRAQTEQACRAEGLEFWTDPHNADPRFLRSRVRHTLLPLLERELGPGVAPTLARTADQLRRDMACLDELADDAFAGLRVVDDERPGGLDVRVDLARLGTMLGAIGDRVLRLAALEAGCPPSELFEVHVAALDDLVARAERGRQVQLPGHVTAYVDGRHLAFRRTPPAP